MKQVMSTTATPTAAPDPYGSKTITFTLDDLIAIEMALEDRFVTLTLRVAAEPANTARRASLDRTRKALELVI
jgi:hypothetical protein